MASAPAKLTQAQKQTKLRSGIQPLQIMINTNYLAKSQFPLTSDLFEFPYLTGKPSNLEKYPLISTNVKYDKSRTRLLTHVEKYQIVFSMSALLQFIGNLPIQDDSKKDKILKHNAEFILDMLFPVSYPVVKKVWVASNSEFAMSFGEAFEKEFAYDKFKFNTYLKLDGKSCTVDEVAYMDTFGKNPVYVKLYDLAKDFLAKRDAAIPVLSADITIRLNEFEKVVSKRKEDVIQSVVTELNSLSGNSTDDILLNNKLVTELNDNKKELADVQGEIVKYEKLFEAKAELLDFRKSGTLLVKIERVIKEMSDYLDNFTAFNGVILSNLYKSDNLTEIENKKKVVEALTQTSPLTTRSTIKTKKDFDSTKEALIRGFNGLINYLNVVKATGKTIVEAEKLDNKTLQKKETELEASIDSLNDQIKKINNKKKINPTFIGATSTDKGFTTQNVSTALDEKTTDHKSKIKNLNTKLKQLVDEYELVNDNFVVMCATIDTNLLSISTSKNFETIKNTIKSVYDSNEKYFSQRTSLTEAFMKLRKICGFAYLITTMHQQQENLNIEREYNINYNIDADLKKGEYLFHKTIAEALRAYYYPNRQSMEPKIKEMISVKDNQPIDMDAIVTLFENEPNTPAAIDLVDLNGKPRYECQVTMILVGGIITPENSSKINCPYENQTIGAKISKKKFDLAISEFVDLTQQIEEIEKKYKIKYEKQKLSNINSGKSGGTNVPSVAAPAPAAAPAAAPAPKNKMRTVKESEVQDIINANMLQTGSGPSLEQLKKFVNADKKIKDFLETAIIISEVNPNELINKTDTYTNLYKNKLIDAESQISTEIKKKTNEAENPNIDNTKKNELTNEIAILNTLTTVIKNIDAEKKKLIKGGRKTKKCRQKRRKYARAKTQKRVH